MARDAETIRALARLLVQSTKSVALTGAGASTESGIPDFRSRDGLWSRFDPMEYGTIGAFRRDPVKVWQMLGELLSITGARPNPGHLALARLEEMGLLAGIVTQNIDGLHQQAGSRVVVELHGSLETLSCLACGERIPFTQIKGDPLPPRCFACGFILKPDVVFFDEQIPQAAIHAAEELLAGAELLLVIGTSCQVVPAALFPEMVAARGGKIVEVNLAPVLGDRAAVVLARPFGTAMEQLVRKVETVVRER